MLQITSRPVLMLAIAGFFSAASIRACDSLLPAIAEDFDVSIPVAAIAVTAFALSYGVAQLIYGPIGSRIGAYQTATLGTLAAGLMTFACAFSVDITSLALARMASGIGAAAVIPMAMAYIGETVPYENRQPVIARFLMGSILGFIFGLAFAGLLAQVWDWRQLFVMIAIGYLAIGGLLVSSILRRTVALPVPSGGSRNPIIQYAAVLRLPWARIVLLTVLLEGFFCFGAFPYMSALLENRFALDDLAIGLVMSCFSAGALIFVALSRRMLGWWGEIGVAAYGGAALGLGYLAIAGAWTWWVVVPGAIFAGLGYFMMHNTLQTNATQMAPADRSGAIALFAFCLFVGQSAGAMGAGWVAIGTGYPLLFVLAGVALTALGLFFAHAKRARLLADG